MKPATLKDYYQLAKPGIVYGNLLTAAGGFLLASQGLIDFGLLLATMAGIALVIASACVFNNSIDSDIDAHMARTKQRAVVRGVISRQTARVYGAALGVAGFFVLSWYTNSLVVMIGLVGFLSYVAVYTFAKRHTPYATLIGTVSGATPIVAGYCAVTYRFDMGALLLFLALVFWQMAHFYAIALYRIDEYKAAHIPIWPLQKGIDSTKQQIVLFIGAFLGVLVSLVVGGYLSLISLIIVGAVSLKWLGRGLRGRHVRDSRTWAREMFQLSLVVIVVFSAVLSIDHFLP